MATRRLRLSPFGPSVVCYFIHHAPGPVAGGNRSIAHPLAESSFPLAGRRGPWNTLLRSGSESGLSSNIEPPFCSFRAANVRERVAAPHSNAGARPNSEPHGGTGAGARPGEPALPGTRRIEQRMPLHGKESLSKAGCKRVRAGRPPGQKWRMIMWSTRTSCPAMSCKTPSRVKRLFRKRKGGRRADPSSAISSRQSHGIQHPGRRSWEALRKSAHRPVDHALRRLPSAPRSGCEAPRSTFAPFPLPYCAEPSLPPAAPVDRRDSRLNCSASAQSRMISSRFGECTADSPRGDRVKDGILLPDNRAPRSAPRPTAPRCFCGGSANAKRVRDLLRRSLRHGGDLRRR